MDYLLRILITINIYIILTLTLNLIVGYLGVLNLGHPGFYGTGAYTYALLSLHGVSFPLAVLSSAGLSALLGFFLGLSSLRLRSHYMAIASLGFLIIVLSLIVNLPSLTRGPLGIPGIPKPELFGYTFQSNFSFFLLSIVFTFFIALFLYRLIHSPFWKIVEAIREDEIAAQTLGKNTLKYKLQVFVLSAFFAGIGGALLASFLGFINVQTFNIDELIFVICMVVVGGMASFWGSIVGATLLVLLDESVRFFTFVPSQIIGPVRFSLFGLVLIFFMIFRPNGILGKRTNIFSK